MKRRPADDLVFFIDRSLGGRLVAQALKGMRNRTVSKPAPFIYTLSASGQFALVR